MKRRDALAWLGGAGALLALAPGELFGSPNPHDLAVEGLELLSAGQLDKALEVLQKARRLDPRNDRVWALLGRVWFKKGDVRQALDAFRLAVRLNPEDTMSRIMVETIEQFPLPAPAPQPDQPDADARSPLRARRSVNRLSDLEREAKAERQQLMETGKRGRASGPFRLVLDPGHGGSDPGAAGSGLREADVALDISLRLARILAAAKDTVTVSLTRVADAGLPGWARAGLAGWYAADMLLSIHATRIPDTAVGGVAICTFGQHAAGAVAAAVAQTENAAYGREDPAAGQGSGELFVRATRLAAATGLRRRGAALAGWCRAAWPAKAPLAVLPLQTAPLRLLAEADAPAMLVEMGFLSHAGDAAVLGVPEKRQALAQSLAQAVLAMARQASAR